MDPTLFDHLPVVVCETIPVRDDAGNIVDLEWSAANALMNRSILPEGGSIVGMRVFEFDPSYRDSEMVRAVLKVLETGEPLTFLTNRGRAAQMFRQVMKTVIVPTERGVLSCSHEVTDIAHERDAALAKSELMDAACDNGVHGLVISDHKGKILYVNRALCGLLGYAREELVGADAGLMMGTGRFQPSPELMEKIRSRQAFEHVTDSEMVTKSGDIVRISAAMSSAYPTADQKPVFITHIQDVREERRKAHELRDALHRAEQATRMKSEFLANMSHEIRTPLNGVLGMAEILSKGKLTPAQQEQVETILDSGKTLMSILNDILDLSKIEAGKLEVSPIAGDLRHKLSRAFKMHEAMARERGLNLQLFIDPSVPSRLIFDPVRVRQCVDNLVSNAMKFTQRGDVLLVVTCEPLPQGENRITIHVSDTGCGIPADKIDSVFESFSQADGSTTRQYGGTGLGLPITRKLARMMGGDLTAVSEPGRGSVFTLKFIAETSESVWDASDFRGDHPVRAGQGTRLGGHRALVVDDNSINRKVSRSFLEHAGLDVTEAVDGRDALKTLEREPFDIVLMDIHMPILDGVEAFKRLRESEYPNRHVPVVALTADSMRGDREKFIAKGFDGYVSKPVDERSLTTVIGQILGVTSDLEERRRSA